MRPRRVNLLLDAAIFLLLACMPAMALVPVPRLEGRVTDNARILSAATTEHLSELLKSHENRTTNQVAVLTVTTLDNEPIEEFAIRVFDVWKLGRKDRDNGVLVIVAVLDRRMRIEVGYGLEGVLTDLRAGRIIEDVMAPRFRADDFDGGLTAGTMAIITQLEDPEAAVADDASSSGGGDSFFEGPDLSIMERILFGCFIFGIIGLFTVIGVLTPSGMGWFLYLFLIPFWAMFPIVVVGVKGAITLLAIYLAGFPAAKLIMSRTEWYKKAGLDLKTKGTATIGGMTFSSSSSGGWSSSGGSGGFSGGGGSSGGGGASGGW